MLCAIVDETAYVAGTFGKKHFRLAEMAVKESQQRQGLGRFMIGLLKTACAEKGIAEI